MVEHGTAWDASRRRRGDQAALLFAVILGSVEPRAAVQAQVDLDVLALEILQRAAQGGAQRRPTPIFRVSQLVQLLPLQRL